MSEFLQGHRAPDFYIDWDLPTVSHDEIDKAIRGAYKLTLYPYYFARNHRSKRINKKWHSKYGIKKCTEKEERFFVNHNKRLIFVNFKYNI